MKDTAGYYDRYWSEGGWPQDIPRGHFPSELRALLLRYLNPSTSILDAGCGDGAKYGVWLASQVQTYTGVDVSEHAVETARSRGLNARAVKDIASLDFQDRQFDAVISVEVLEHLVHPEEAASEILRILRPGGTFIATVPNIMYWRRRLDYVLLGRWHPGGHPQGALYPWRDPHLRFFTRRTLQRMLSEAGFKILEVRGVDGRLFGDLPYVARRFGTEQLSRPFRVLQDMAPSLFGANLAVVAERPLR